MVVLSLLCSVLCLGAVMGMSATWDYANDHALGLSSQSLSDLRYTRILYNSTDAEHFACGIIAFNAASFNGTDLGPPGQFVFGKCGQNMTITFNSHPIKFVRFIFASTPFRGTNVTKLEAGGVLINKPDFSFDVVNPSESLLAKRGKCFNCAGNVVFSNSKGTLLFDNLRLQAYVPKKSAVKGTFSPADPDSVCSVDITGFDAALYFGIAIAVLGVFGVAIYLKHYIAALLKYWKYRRINQ